MVDRVSLSGKIDGLGPILQQREHEEGSSNFIDVLKNSLEEVNRLQQEADQTIQDFVTRESADIHDVFIAMEKADISFRMVMRVRDKLLEAYQEITRMQV